jgi:hypothetical protein
MSAGLASRQQALLQALLQPRHADAIESIAAHAHPMRAAARNHWERGVLAYRSNGQELAGRALGAAYPVVAQLLGADNFQALAVRAWQQQPPARGDLAQWGAGLPELIAGLPDLAREEPYLADVARTEWALHCAASAADAVADVASFGLLAQADPARVTLALGPGAICVASEYPVASIVTAHLRGEPTLQEAGERLRAGVAETALVWREGLKPRVRVALPGEAQFIAAVQSGLPLLQALAAVPDLDFNRWLAPAVQTGLLLGAHAL